MSPQVRIFYSFFNIGQVIVGHLCIINVQSETGEDGFMSVVAVEIHKQADYSRWGRLSVLATQKAAEKLSGDAFKLWTLLAINQHEYSYRLDITPELSGAVDELEDAGYLVFRAESIIFFEDAVVEECMLPMQWLSIYDSYSLTGKGAAGADSRTT